MILEYGDMWSIWPETDLFLITANSYIKRTGQLVMGAGIARQARDRFPDLDATLGQAIRESCGHLGEYGLLISPRWPAARLGLFQVKYQWSTEALPELIQRSADKLTAWAHAHPDRRIDLNFPGIGNGRLSPEQVLPIIEQLPGNVHVWRYRTPGGGANRSSQTPSQEARRVGGRATVQQALHDLRVDLIYHSEALEGSPLTRSEIRDIVAERKITTRASACEWGDRGSEVRVVKETDIAFKDGGEFPPGTAGGPPDQHHSPTREGALTAHALPTPRA